jgi:hypothetical protein
LDEPAVDLNHLEAETTRVNQIQSQQSTVRNFGEGLATKDDIAELKDVVHKFVQKTEAQQGPKPPKKRNFDEISYEERKRCFQNGLCFGCKQSGHLVGDCPRKQQPDTANLPRGNRRWQNAAGKIAKVEEAPSIKKD